MSQKPTFEGYLVKCPNCGDDNNLQGEIWADTWECGSCGTHGEVTLSLYDTCAHCGYKFKDTIELSSW